MQDKETEMFKKEEND